MNAIGKIITAITLIIIGGYAINYAGECGYTGSQIKAGRDYGKKISRVQVEEDGWVLFKFTKTTGDESEWVSINPSNGVGNSSLSLLLTSISTEIPISLYISDCNVTHGGGVVSKDIQIHK